MQNQWTAPLITTAVLGILGFLLSCYNFLIVQKRKDKEDRQKRLSDIRFRFGQRRQEAMELVVAVELAVLRKKQLLDDASSQALRAGRSSSVAQLKEPVADAGKELLEAKSRSKELVRLTPPDDADVDLLLKLEESYGKMITGLKIEMATREAEMKKVEEIVEIVKDDIKKHSGGQVP